MVVGPAQRNEESCLCMIQNRGGSLRGPRADVGFGDRNLGGVLWRGRDTHFLLCSLKGVCIGAQYFFELGCFSCENQSSMDGIEKCFSQGCEIDQIGVLSLIFKRFRSRQVVYNSWVLVTMCELLTS